MLDPEKFPIEVFGFHAQQTVEKCLKAWLCRFGIVFGKTHSIRHLINLLGSADVDTAELWNFAELTAFAVQFRYDSYEGIEEDELERRDLIASVETLHRRVKVQLSK